MFFIMIVILNSTRHTINKHLFSNSPAFKVAEILIAKKSTTFVNSF